MVSPPVSHFIVVVTIVLILKVFQPVSYKGFLMAFMVSNLGLRYAALHGNMAAASAWTVHCLTGSALSVLVAALSTVVAEVVDKGAPTGMAEAFTAEQSLHRFLGCGAFHLVEALDQQRRQFEDEGKYEDAEQVKQRLELLQEKADAKRREALRQRQLAQRLGVEEAHMKELQEFNQHWDQKVAEFEAHAASLQSQLQDRHNQEFAEARKKFEMETEPRNPRFSKDLLNLRKIQEPTPP
eukprot:s803_g16.t1